MPHPYCKFAGMVRSDGVRMPRREILRRAVERELNCKARLIATELVSEEFDLRPPWAGVVYHFALKGHPISDLAYAWSRPATEDRPEKLVIVLRSDPVVTARDAVRKVALAEYDLPPRLT